MVGGFFLAPLCTVGSLMLSITFIQKLVQPKCRRCKVTAFAILRFLYNMNLFTLIIIVILSAIKIDSLALIEDSWDVLISPTYFFMTELVLISIISFVVLINSVIQLCCSKRSTSDALASRPNPTFHSQLHNIQNNLRPVVNFQDRSSNSSNLEGMSAVSGYSRTESKSSRNESKFCYLS